MTTLLNRRQWLKAAGVTLAATAVAPRLSRLEAAVAPTPPPAAPGPVQLSWNENPFGPSPAVQEVMRAAVDRTCRYPDAEEDALREMIAAREGVPPAQVLLGCGSGEILEAAGLHYGA